MQVGLSAGLTNLGQLAALSIMGCRKLCNTTKHWLPRLKDHALLRHLTVRMCPQARDADSAEPSEPQNSMSAAGGERPSPCGPVKAVLAGRGLLLRPQASLCHLLQQYASEISVAMALALHSLESERARAPQLTLQLSLSSLHCLGQRLQCSLLLPIRA